MSETIQSEYEGYVFMFDCRLERNCTREEDFDKVVLVRLQVMSIFHRSSYCNLLRKPWSQAGAV